MKKFSARPDQPPFKPPEEVIEEKPNAFWNRVYLSVIVTTVFVIAALWTFSRYFSG